MATIRVTVMDDDGNRHDFEESVGSEVNDDLVYTIACGLLYQSDWIPGSLRNPVITVDGREIETEERI